MTTSSDKNKILKDINKKIIYGKSIEEVLSDFFDKLKPHIPYDRIGVAVLEKEILRYIWTKSDIPINALKENYFANISGSLEKILNSGEPRIINDLESYLNEHPQSFSTELALKDGLRSSLAYPLIYKGRRLGVIFFSSINKNIYQKPHMDVFQDFSESISLAVGYHTLKVQEQNLRKDKILSNVVHDLREPIGIMIGFLSLTMEEDWYKALSDDQKRSLHILDRNCHLMLDLVDDLNRVRRMERNEMDFSVVDVDLHSFIKEVCVDAEMISRSKNIHFNLKISDKLPEKLKFDPKRIHQVLNNLVSNAAKFSWPNTNIALDIHSESDQLVFSVTDQGQGVPKDEIPKLFTEFGKTSARPTGGEASNGLGLAICKYIVEKHGGQISVDTEVGRGSTFKFSLPLWK